MSKVVHKQEKYFDKDHRCYYVKTIYLCGVKMLETFTQSSLKKSEVTCKRCLKKLKNKGEK